MRDPYLTGELGYNQPLDVDGLSTSYFDVLNASYESQKLRGVTSLAMYSDAFGMLREQFPNEKPMPFEETKKKVLESGYDIKIPRAGLTRGMFNAIIQRRKKLDFYDSVINRGKTGSSFLNFGGALAATFTDPIEVGIGIAFEPLFTARMATRLATTTGFGARAALRAKMGAVEGIAGQLALEPGMHYFSDYVGDEYTMMDTLMNVGVGAVMGAGLSVGMGGIRDYAKIQSGGIPGRLDYGELDPQWRDKAKAMRPIVEAIKDFVPVEMKQRYKQLLDVVSDENIKSDEFLFASSEFTNIAKTISADRVKAFRDTLPDDISGVNADGTISSVLFDPQLRELMYPKLDKLTKEVLDTLPEDFKPKDIAPIFADSTPEDIAEFSKEFQTGKNLDNVIESSQKENPEIINQVSKAYQAYKEGAELSPMTPFERVKALTPEQRYDVFNYGYQLIKDGSDFDLSPVFDFVEGKINQTEYMSRVKNIPDTPEAKAIDREIGSKVEKGEYEEMNSDTAQRDIDKIMNDLSRYSGVKPEPKAEPKPEAKPEPKKKAKPKETKAEQIRKELESVEPPKTKEEMEAAYSAFKDEYADYIGKLSKYMDSTVRLSEGGEFKGQYDPAKNLIEVFEKAFKAGEFNQTLVHEVWHSLARFLPAEDMRAMNREFQAQRNKFYLSNPHLKDILTKNQYVDGSRGLIGKEAKAFKKKYRVKDLPDVRIDRNGNIVLRYTPKNYRYTNLDEFFAETMKDEFFRLDDLRLDRAKGVWDFVNRVFKNGIRFFMKHFGKDETARIFDNYLRGSYEKTQLRTAFGRGADLKLATIEKLTNLVSSFDLANERQYPNNRDFKIAMQDRTNAEAIKNKFPLNKMTPEVEQYLINVGIRDAETALETNPNAVGWYNEKVTKALKLLSLIHPEIDQNPQSKFAFTWALAVTSNGLKVDKNFELAEKAYRLFKDEGKMPENIGIGTASGGINTAMKLFNSLVDKHGFDNVMDFMTSKHTVKEVESFTGTKISGEGKNTEVYGAAAVGPKIGNGFFANLYGNFEQLTMDRWFMRTWGRWTGTLVQVDEKKVKEKTTKLKKLISILSPKEKKEFQKIIGVKISQKNAVEVGEAIQKSSVEPALRKQMSLIGIADQESKQKSLEDILGKAKGGKLRIGLGDELRKMGNNLVKDMDGQKEAPAGVRERDAIRNVLNQVLSDLQIDYPDLTMSDLQALLWYPEKRLYDSSKAKDSNVKGYSDDEAPDYANAAESIARKLGASDEEIRKAIEQVDQKLSTNERTTGARRRTNGLGVGEVRRRELPELPETKEVEPEILRMATESAEDEIPEPDLSTPEGVQEKIAQIEEEIKTELDFSDAVRAIKEDPFNRGMVRTKLLDEFRTLKAVDIDEVFNFLDQRLEVARNKDSTINPADIINESLDELAEGIRTTALIKKRGELFNLKYRLEGKNRIDQYPIEDIYEAFVSLLTGSYKKDLEGNNVFGGMVSVKSSQRSESGRILGSLVTYLRKNELMDLFDDKTISKDLFSVMWRRANGLEVQPREFSDELIMIADKVAELQEFSRTRANEKGAWINKLDGRVVGQTYDMYRVRKNLESFRALLLDGWDFERSFDRQLSPEEISDIVDQTVRNIASGIHHKDADAMPALFVLPGVGKKLSHSRKIHWKSEDFAYTAMSEYGIADNVQQAIFGELDRMGRSIGTMSILGPSHRHNLAMMAKQKRIELANESPVIYGKTIDSLSPIERAEGRVFQILNFLDGTDNIPVDHVVAQAGSIIRNLTTLSSFGSVVLSQLGDIPVAASEARSSFGMNFVQSYWTGISGILNMFRGGKMREIAEDLGIVSEALTGRVLAKYEADEPGVMTKAMNTYFKYNLMQNWTDAQRVAYGLAFTREFARQSGKRFDQLDSNFKNLLKEYGIDSADWDIARQKGIESTEMGDMLSVTKLEAEAFEVGEKFREVLLDRVYTAAIEPDARTRSKFLAGKRGEWGREITAALMQFKTYSSAIFNQVYRRNLDRGQKGLMVETFALATIFGVASYQLKEISKGKEPVDMEKFPGKVLLSGAVKGGGLGIFGDFIFGEYNRFGGGFASTVAGPSLGKIGAGVELFQKARAGEADAADFLRFSLGSSAFIGAGIGYGVGGAQGAATGALSAALLNLMYVRPVLNHLAVHKLQDMASPGYFERTRNRMMKEKGQDWLVDPLYFYR